MNTIEIICTVISAAVAVIAAILGGVKYLLDRERMYAENNQKLSNLEKKTGKLPCEEHGQSIGTLEHNINSIKETMQSNNGMLVELSRWAMHMDESRIEKLAQKCSPLQMTKAGGYLYKISKAKDAINQIADRLIHEMESMNLRTELDVEDKSLDLILKNNNDVAFDPVKKYVYYSPDTIQVGNTGETIKFNMLSLMKLMSIDLRDRYLAKHPEIVNS